MPFIVEDKNKFFYYCGLKEYVKEKGFLRETCYAGQDFIKKLLDLFEISY